MLVLLVAARFVNPDRARDRSIRRARCDLGAWRGDFDERARAPRETAIRSVKSPTESVRGRRLCTSHTGDLCRPSLYKRDAIRGHLLAGVAFTRGSALRTPDAYRRVEWRLDPLKSIVADVRGASIRRSGMVQQRSAGRATASRKPVPSGHARSSTWAGGGGSAEAHGVAEPARQHQSLNPRLPDLPTARATRFVGIS
jgi:hypothetical protein